MRAPGGTMGWMTSPTYLLVHGAWGGAWCWRDLGAELDARRLAWSAPELPSSHDESGRATLADDATALVAAAAGLGPVVLVAHSYAGAVALEALPRLGEVESVVFVAAYVPHVGESVTQIARTAPEPTLLDEAIVADGPLLRLDPALAGEALYAGCDAPTRDWAVSMLGPQTRASFRAPRVAPDAPVPRRYVVCHADEAVDPDVQAAMSGRCDEWVALDTDHSPFFSAPARLADVLSVADAGV